MSEEASTGNDIVIANPAAVTLENADNEQAKDTTSAPVDQGAVTKMSTSAVRFTVSEVTENQVQTPQKTAYEVSIQQWRDRQKPVKERNLKLYKIISVIAIIAFFPTGIPALWNSFKLQEEFYDGIQKGDLAKCNKRALLLNKLLILSFTLCMFTVILILAVYGGVKGGPTGHITFAQSHLY